MEEDNQKIQAEKAKLANEVETLKQSLNEAKNGLQIKDDFISKLNETNQISIADFDKCTNSASGKFKRNFRVF